MADHDDLPFTLLFAQEPPSAYREKREPFDATAAVADLFGQAGSTLSHPRILLVASSTDATVDAIGAEAVRRGIPTARLNGDDLSVRSSLAVWMEDHSLRGRLRLPSGPVELDRVESVFWRLRSAGPRRIAGPYAAFRRSEVAAALEDLEPLLHEARWIERPTCVRASGSKLEHLRLAAELGFEVPRTLVTDDSEAARTFVDSCESAVVKAFNWLWDEPGSGRRSVIFTHRLGGDDRSRLGLVENAPCIFQEEVPRRVEWRVTVVGSEVFVAEITCEALAPGSAVDWRDPACRPRYRAGRLPDEVEQRCANLAHRLDLQLATMDLIETPDGRYVFLDFNVYGNWLHVERHAGLRITQAVVDLLVHETQATRGSSGGRC